MNMIKVMPFIYQQSLVHLTMLLLEGSSETRLLRHLFNRFLESVISEIHQLWGSSFFEKSWKFNLDFKIAEESWENNFCVWDNCSWIDCFKFSLLSREYLWPAFNVSTNSPKSFHITKREFFQLNCFHSD